ncbi:hypothetical protein [Thermopirellula anaerolimosa]
MLKKILIGSGVLLLTGTFFFGRDLISYVRTSAGLAQEAVVDAVPLEFQIRRARTMIDGLIPEIRSNMHAIAREEVEVERLDRQIAQMRESLASEKAAIARLRDDAASGKAKVVYAGREYTADQVRADLTARFERFKVNEATLAGMEQIHAARTRTLQAAREKMEGMLAAKRQLEVEVANLTARLQMIEAAQTASSLQIDGSRLGRVRELISDLRAKLDVAERMVAAESQYRGEIPVEQADKPGIVEEVTRYFGGEQETETAAAEGEDAPQGDVAQMR